MDAQENLPYYIPNDIVEVSDMSSGSELDSRSQGEEETNSTEDAVMDVVSNSDSIELVPEHRYLGNLQEVKGSKYYENNAIVRLPVVVIYAGVTLVPGQILPLVTDTPSTVNAITHALNSDHVIGVVSIYNWIEHGDFTINNFKGLIGTSANILERGRNEDGSLRVKSRGSQLFKVLHVEDPHDIPNMFVHARIIPDIRLPYILEGARIQSLNKHRSRNRNLCMQMEAARTRWPLWVYKNYDEHTLMKDLKNKFSQRFRGIKFMDGASELSFQLFKLLHVSSKVSVQVLVLKSPIQRLRWINSVVTREGRRFHCITCYKILGNQRDSFSMGVAGPHGTYVNPQGYVHELLTFLKLSNYTLTGEHESEFSWFPGYSWCIMKCTRCHTHLGWEFKGETEDMVPHQFFGVKNMSIKIQPIELTSDSEWPQNCYVH